ncbi:relaxase domain-containing protein [Streptomyces niveus]|uniref:relaxase domain-containing protein n=1 Tax=Streptomyces niveus TaxID=193462 RepID=UPI002E32EF50|nr:hypothetical protein [Streptomyces niveus]
MERPGQRLIGWQSTRRQQIADAMPALVADYEETHGHPPGERAAYGLEDRTRPPKRTVARSPSELRDGWRRSAIRKVSACTVYRLAQRPPRSGPGWRPWSTSPWRRWTSPRWCS